MISETEQSTPQSNNISIDLFTRDYPKNFKYLVSYITRRFPTLKSQAEDIAQEAILNGYTKQNTFRGECNYKTWITVIARNNAINRINKERTRPVSWNYNLEDFSEFPDEFRHPARNLENEEEEDVKIEAYNCITGNFREILDLRLAGKEYQEIAEIIGIPIGTVKSRVCRAKKYARIKKRTIVKL